MPADLVIFSAWILRVVESSGIILLRALAIMTSHWQWMVSPCSSSPKWYAPIVDPLCDNTKNIVFVSMIEPSVKERISRNKEIVLASLFMIVGSTIACRCFATESFPFGISLGINVTGRLFVMIALRRIFWHRQFPLGGRWSIAVNWLLWISLLIIPITAGIMYAWSLFSDAPDNMARLLDSIYMLFFVGASICVAYATASLAYLIQLYRNQWRVKLSFVVMIFLFLVYVFYVFISCGGELI